MLTREEKNIISRQEDYATKNSGKFLSTSVTLLTSDHLFNDFYAGFFMPLLSYFSVASPFNHHTGIYPAHCISSVWFNFTACIRFLGDRFHKKLFVVSGALCPAIFMSCMSILFTERELTMQKGGIAISTFLISGSIGGLIGGYLADRINTKMIIAGFLPDYVIQAGSLRLQKDSKHQSSIYKNLQRFKRE